MVPNFITLAMNGWAAPEPAWWLNLQASPDATLDLHDRSMPVRGRVAEGEERERLWARWQEHGDDVDSFATLPTNRDSGRRPGAPSRLVRQYSGGMTSGNAVPPRATRREWIGLGVLTLAALVYSMDLTVLNLAIPRISAELRPTSVQLLWIIDIYGFLVAGLLITMGTLGIGSAGASSCSAAPPASRSRHSWRPSRPARRC